MNSKYHLRIYLFLTTFIPMIKQKFALRWFHFLAAWALCLVTGIVLQSVVMIVTGLDSDAVLFALLTALIAFLVSLPFIIVFCIVVHFTILNQELTRSQIHLRVLLYHVVGAILVFLGLIVFANHEMQSSAGIAALIMLGYFTIDSIYFALFIHRNTREIIVSEIYNEDLLDTTY